MGEMGTVKSDRVLSRADAIDCFVDPTTVTFASLTGSFPYLILLKLWQKNFGGFVFFGEHHEYDGEINS